MSQRRFNAHGYDRREEREADLEEPDFRRPVDLDRVVGLATQAAIAAPEQRAVLLAEIRVLLDQAPADEHTEAIRLEVERLAREAAR